MRGAVCLRNLVGGAMFLVLGACAGGQGPGSSAVVPETATVRSASEQRIGDDAHPKILAQYGGVYQDADLTRYVNEIGRSLAAVSEQPDARWTFTVLDSPIVNAFAVPGGYVYVTRGLVALANSEAELAGVIGHEIGHVTAGHSSLRQSRSAIATGGALAAVLAGAVLGVDPSVMRVLSTSAQQVAGGVLASYSRGDELDADYLGIRYLARAGYDPYAQVDFLESMGASSALDARVAGRAYNPNRVDFLASHPASGPRTRQAIVSAQAAGQAIPTDAARNRDAYLSAINGVTYGDSAQQGFVRGNRFVHPDLRFAFSAPSGFTIVNATRAVTAQGPANARFILDGDRFDGALTDYIANRWAPGIGQNYRTGAVQGLRAITINGLPAAEALLPIDLDGTIVDAVLVAVRLDGALYRMTGLAPRGSGLLDDLTGASRSFRRLSVTEASRERPQTIAIVTVRPGDTVGSIAARMSVPDFREERFRVLNGLSANDTVRAGDKVKIIR